jgi:hypothetical protein
MRWLVLPDLQVPDHDASLVKRLAEWVSYQEFDGIACVGDELDSPEPSRWNKGYAGEYAGTLQKGIDTCHQVLGLFAEALGEGKPFHLMRSNHGERIRTYIARYAPALASLQVLDYERLLGLDELDITYHEKPYEFAPNWLLAHGDEGSLSQAAGGTALGLAKRWGKSVVCGHTHRAGIQHQHHSVGGRVVRPLFGMEVGHLMDMRKASYLKGGSANWQQAFGVLEVDGRHVKPTLVPIISGRW